MAYSVFIGKLQLPFNPEKIKDSIDRKAKDFDVLGAGTVPKLENASLKTWSFECDLVPHNSLQSESWKEPAEVISTLEQYLKDGLPQRLVISNGTSYGVSSLIYLVGLEKTEVGIGTYEIELKLCEYKESAVRETGIPFIQRPGIIPEKKVPKSGSKFNQKKSDNDKSTMSPEEEKWWAEMYLTTGQKGSVKTITKTTPYGSVNNDPYKWWGSEEDTIHQNLVQTKGG